MASKPQEDQPAVPCTAHSPQPTGKPGFPVLLLSPSPTPSVRCSGPSLGGPLCFLLASPLNILQGPLGAGSELGGAATLGFPTPLSVRVRAGMKASDPRAGPGSGQQPNREAQPQEDPPQGRTAWEQPAQPQGLSTGLPTPAPEAEMG